MKPIIYEELCIGDGICEDICPSVFKLQGDGLAHVLDEEPDKGLWPKIEEAVRECPTEAIILAGYGSDEEVAA